MSWRKKKDDDLKRWKEMFPWLPIDMFEESGFFSDDFMEQIMKEIDRMMKEFNTTDQDAFRKKMGPIVWGWNLSMGPDGKPTFKEFGNVKPSESGEPIAKEDREPLIDVFIEETQVRVVAELPGVEKNDINVKTTDSKIIIEAKGIDRNYSCERELSVKIKPKTATAKYRNGILELTIQRLEPAQEKGFEVKIE
ncbi:MAG: Hsp20/alpha crystallin family protein [Asgard group archaeon]|nr:Hsp20/alpha crystallin family protein [Asgard group archaeon]